MVATTTRDKKKRTKDDDLLLFAMAAAGTGAGSSLDAEGIFDDLLQASGFFPSPTYSGPVAAPENPLNDIIANAPSVNLTALGTTALASTLASSVIERIKKPAITPDIAPAPKKSPVLDGALGANDMIKARAQLDIDAPDIKVGHSHNRFGSIFSVAATATTLSAVALTSATGEIEQAEPGPFNFFGEVAHWTQIVGHGLQNGIVGLMGAGEDIYDLADSLSGDRLWGDSTTNSTTEFLTNFADNNLVRVPEMRNDFERAIHKISEVGTLLVPLGSVAKVAGLGAKTIVAIRAADVTWDVASLNSMGVSMTGENIPELAGDFAENAAKTVADLAKGTPTPAPNAPAQTFDMA